MNVKRIVLIVVAAFLVGVLGFLGFNYVRALTDKKENPIVSIEVEGYGTVEIELYPDIAPNTVKNFIKLAESGFYDGKTFSEIGDTFVKGGLDLTKPEDTESEKTEASEEVAVVGSETGEEKETIVGPKLSDVKDLDDDEEDAAYSIKGEFSDAGFTDNRLSHERGIVSMARVDYSDYQKEIAMMQMLGDDYSSTLEYIIDKMNDSATSGFFILTDNDTSYNGTYTAFGKVVSGMDIVDKISEVETTEEDGKKVPKTQPVIKSMKVDTKGVDYGSPETIEVFDFDSIFNMFLSNYVNS